MPRVTDPEVQMRIIADIHRKVDYAQLARKHRVSRSAITRIERRYKIKAMRTKAPAKTVADPETSGRRSLEEVVLYAVLQDLRKLEKAIARDRIRPDILEDAYDAWEFLTSEDDAEVVRQRSLFFEATGWDIEITLRNVRDQFPLAVVMVEGR